MSCTQEKKRVLVTGATGLLGRAVSKEFFSSGRWEVLGLGLSRARGEVLHVDLLDEEAVKKVVASFKPDVIVHTAAERRIDRCENEKEKSRLLNVEVTRRLARLAKEHGAWLLFISTDYLFDGKSPPYSESSALNPLNEYGRQKRDAGMAARAEDWGCGVLRLPLLYGDVETLDESGVSGLLAQLLDSSKPVQLDNWQIRHPTLVDDVAYVCRELADQKMSHCGLSGVFHFSGEEPMTRYEMALKMADALGLGELKHVSPAPIKEDPLRPHNAKLDSSTLKLMGIQRQTPFSVGIHKLDKWVKK